MQPPSHGRDLLKVTNVSVVQSVDLEGLQETLSWLVDTVLKLPAASQNAAPVDSGALQEQIDTLRRELGQLKEAGASQDRDQPRDQTQASDLESRVAALEARLPPAAGSDAPAAASRDAPPTAAAADAAGSTVPSDAQHPGTGSSTAAADAAGPDLAAKVEELLAAQRALAARLDGIQQDLNAKPSREDLDAKANRSELDALLRAGASAAVAEPPSGGGDAAAAAATASPPAVALAADGQLDNSALVEAVNKAAADLMAMRGQLAVLQDRLEHKAEKAALDDVAGQLASVSKVHAASAGADAAAPGAPSAATGRAGAQEGVEGKADVDVSDILKRLVELEAQVAAGAASPPAAAGEGAAVDEISTLSDVQPLLKDIYARLDGKADRSALEDALRRLQELAHALDAKADAAGLQAASEKLQALEDKSGLSGSGGASAGVRPASQQQQQAQQQGAQEQKQWIVSHELVGSESVPAALEDLRAKVADLTEHVSRLAAASSAPVPPTPSGGRASHGADGVDMAALQGALATLQGQLGELGTRLAGKADAGDVNRVEMALNSKADLDELTELRHALNTKADAGAVGELQMALAGKAEQTELEGVKLLAAAAADGNGAPAAGGGAAGGQGAAGADGGAGPAPNLSNLLQQLQGMVADKATKAELQALAAQVAAKAPADEVGTLRAALDAKASAAEVAALASQQSMRAATADEIASLDQRMGDVFSELAKIRSDLAALPAEAASVGAAVAPAQSSGNASARDGADASGLQRMVSALSREVSGLREGLDTVAHAANVLAVGLDGNGRMSTTGGGTGGVEGRYSETGLAGKENRSPRGGYERLAKLLGSGDYRHKMDAFDPTALQQMAQKLAYLEATVKSPAMARVGAGAPAQVDYGMKELERMVKRLATDVRLIKQDKMADSSPMVTGSRMAPGDHAMLAARPITGYRCMACDRPLDQLDVLPGPHIPTSQLPVRGPPVMDRAQVKSGRGEPLSPQSSGQKLQPNVDPNVRGVQNWYKDTQGVAADALPREHVGPHLPPGGWRPSNPGTAPKALADKASAGLPALNGKPKGPSSTSDYQTQNGQVDGATNVVLPQIS